MSVHAHGASDLKSLRWLMGMWSLHSEPYKSWEGGSSVPDHSASLPVPTPESDLVVISSFVLFHFVLFLDRFLLAA